MLFTKASDRDCKAVKWILEIYAKASGQSVNLNKSNMCVSQKVSNDRAEHLARVALGIGARPGISWCPPMEGQLKMNTNAAVDVHSGRVGFGIIIRNHRGEVMASSAQDASAGFSSQVAEAMTIFTGLVFARDVGLLPYLVESDAQVVVNLIKADVIPCSEIEIVVHDIKLFLEAYCSKLCS
ncbi:hypothetical protein Ddye_025479 [Dipteronia dyeriana]|uniref:RNase H type-1 domain-containing protein n=1 Tax=Dipteronia dyeriana TaxID=168575 RepID=A0AAD9TL94_9ROSI|nr:hypothetical protein Ddye_025479 [Dipteronia dyeriana]